jgi:hypothetical protein
MKITQLYSIFLFTGLLCGCASTFDRDIQSPARKSVLTTVDCDSGSATLLTPQFVSGPRVVPATLLNLNLDFLPGNFAEATDLEIGKRILEKTSSDRALFGKSMSAIVGLDLSQFVSEAPFYDHEGAESARKAQDRLRDMNLNDFSKLDGKTITKEDQKQLMEAISKATASSGWASEMTENIGSAVKAIIAYKAARDENSRSMLESAALKGVALATENSTFAAYFKAYFRNGEIFEVKFDSSGLQQKLIESIKKKLGVNADSALIDDLTKEIQKIDASFQSKLCDKGADTSDCSILGAIGTQTFVTRAGKSYGFPGVTATFDPTATKKISTNKLDTNSILEDLVRVSVEAAGDAKGPVPGVVNSTLCKELKHCVQAADTDAVQRANDVGDTTEAASAQVVSIVVRGGWLFSLNNEAAAESLTVGISVAARKFAERVAYAQAKGKCTKPGHRTLTVGFTGP